MQRWPTWARWLVAAYALALTMMVVAGVADAIRWVNHASSPQGQRSRVLHHLESYWGVTIQPDASLTTYGESEPGPHGDSSRFFVFRSDGPAIRTTGAASEAAADPDQARRLVDVIRQEIPEVPTARWESCVKVIHDRRGRLVQCESGDDTIVYEFMI